MSVSRHPSWLAGSTYSPSILVDRWTPFTPWGDPDRPITSPRSTLDPDDCSISDKKLNDTLNPGTGSMVTDLIPATEPAKVIRPEAGARTCEPAAAA
ncbi:MAG: hypothetical protein K0T01_799 [Acidimicrobiia bacterium]|jgi:hypothetical protein|nr:hypothetical protein [Acidimicrobiia bacterium]